jgi:hypothetical protein
LRALGTKNEARYNLKIIDNSDPQAVASQPVDDAVADDTAQAQAADDNTAVDADTETETDTNTAEAADSDAVSKTRKELADLDDLDI